MDVGAVHDNDTCVDAAVADRAVGRDGPANGVAVALVLALPVPPALIALTRKRYDVPFVRPATVYAVDVLEVFATTVVQVVPEFDDDSMR